MAYTRPSPSNNCTSMHLRVVVQGPRGCTCIWIAPTFPFHGRLSCDNFGWTKTSVDFRGVTNRLAMDP